LFAGRETIRAWRANLLSLRGETNTKTSTRRRVNPEVYSGLLAGPRSSRIWLHPRIIAKFLQFGNDSRHAWALKLADVGDRECHWRVLMPATVPQV
jgi:hypothetical protein